MEKATIRQVRDLKEFASITPLLLEGYEQMNKRYKAFNLTREQYVKELIRIMGSENKNGLAVVWVDDRPVGYGAARDNTDLFSSHKVLLLYALYVKPEFSKEYKKPLFDFAEDFGRQQGYHEMVAYNGRFSGASFRLFEKILGMRRKMTMFSKFL